MTHKQMSIGKHREIWSVLWHSVRYGLTCIRTRPIATSSLQTRRICLIEAAETFILNCNVRWYTLHARIVLQKYTTLYQCEDVDSYLLYLDNFFLRCIDHFRPFTPFRIGTVTSLQDVSTSLIPPPLSEPVH